MPRPSRILNETGLFLGLQFQDITAIGVFMLASSQIFEALHLNVLSIISTLFFTTILIKIRSGRSGVVTDSIETVLMISLSSLERKWNVFRNS